MWLYEGERERRRRKETSIILNTDARLSRRKSGYPQRSPEVPKTCKISIVFVSRCWVNSRNSSEVNAETVEVEEARSKKVLAEYHDE